VRVRPEQVAFLRYVLEAHDGLAFMHSDGSGEVWLLAPVGREVALDELIRDLLAEGYVDEIISDDTGQSEG
jgi:hypothetical protein